MIFWFRNLFAYFICSIASIGIAYWIESSIVQEILIPNLLTIVVALLAINVQTIAVIAVKLRELSETYGYNFKKTVSEFRFSIVEQVALVLLSLALASVTKSTVYSKIPLLFEISAFFIFYASLHIFLDTSLSLLLSLFPE